MSIANPLNAARIFPLAVILFVCASCSLISPPLDPAQSLEETAVKLATFLNINDLDGQYYLMSPDYREIHSIEHFKSRKRPAYANVSFVKIDWIDDAHATAYYLADMELMAFKFEQTRIHFSFELTPEGWFIKYTDFYKSL